MLQIKREQELDEQDDDDVITVHAFYINDIRVFATEEGQYLKASPQTLVAVGDTIIMEADRNSQLYDEGPVFCFLERVEEGYRLLKADNIYDKKKREEMLLIASDDWLEIIGNL